MSKSFAAKSPGRHCSQSAVGVQAEEMLWVLDTIELDLGIAEAIVQVLLADDRHTVRGPLQEAVRATERWADEMTVRTEFGECRSRESARLVGRLSNEAAAEARQVRFHLAESFVRSVDEIRDQVVAGLTDLRLAVGAVLLTLD